MIRIFKDVNADRRQKFMTLDTETATIRKANEIASFGLDASTQADKIAKRKQAIAIAKPLVYDIGWVITDRHGEIYKTANFLVSEIFYDQQLFATAYYADKRPIYMEAIARGEVTVMPWNYIMERLMEDMAVCSYITAYNACFDFKKAIPYTELYLSKYYSNTVEDKRVFARWEWGQEQRCKEIVSGQKNEFKKADYLTPTFCFRDIEIPIIDLWGMACTRLINIDKYRKFCLDNGLVSHSIVYFKTSAETSFQYLENQHDFIEDHTALSDALIEAKILAKALKKGKAEPMIVEFPFRNLGKTFDFAVDKYKKAIPDLIEGLEEYLDSLEKASGWKTQMENALAMLQQYAQ